MSEEAKKSGRKGLTGFFANNWKDLIDSFQSVVATLAIFAAGWWFFISGEYAGKAHCTQRLDMVQVTSDSTNVWWCAMDLKVENTGERPFTLDTARIKVVCIQPQTNGFALKLGTHGRYSWGSSVFNNGGTNDSIHIKLLPSDVENVHFEFTLPTNIQVFRVYSYVNRNAGDDSGWDCSCVYGMVSNQPMDISVNQQ